MLIDQFVNFIKTDNPSYSPDLVFDVGSRDLEQSIEFASVWPDSKIFAFEPTPYQFDVCYKKSVEYNGISVFQKAISDSVGISDFWMTPGNIGCSSLLEPQHIPFSSSNKKIKISVEKDTLSNFIKHMGFDEMSIVLWMDVQGHELAALKGLGGFIKNVDYIHLEAAEIPYYEGHSSKKEIEEFLTDNNFIFNFNKAPSHPFKEGDILAKRVK